MVMVVILTSLRWLTVLVTTVLSVHPSTCQVHDSSACDMGHGTQYVTTFLATGATLVTQDDLLLRLTVTNPHAAPKVKITVDPSNQTFTLAPGETQSNLVFNASEALVGSKKHPRGGRVVLTACSEDDATLTVYGSVKSKINDRRTFATFTVLPTTSLGLDYVIVTHCQQNHCFLGIVATQNQTRVNVTLRLRHYDDKLDPLVNYDSVTYKDGDVIEEVLDPFQAMQVLCYVCDMSGSRVTASFPVAVLSGGDFTMIDNSQKRKDSFLEFLPPTDALGTRHVVAKTTGSEVVVKVVAVKKGTIISALDECYLVDHDGDTWTWTLSESKSSFMLDSTLPVLVTLLHSTSYGAYDMSMTLLSPVSQWNTESYDVVQHYDDFHSELVIVAFGDNGMGCLKIGENVLNFSTGLNDTWDPLNGLVVFSVPVYDSVMQSERLWCDAASCVSTCNPFWGYLHSWKDTNFGKGYAMPLGIFRRGVEQRPREVPANCSYLLLQTTTATPSASSSPPVATDTFLQDATSYGIIPSSPLSVMTSLPVASSFPAHVTSETYLQDVTSNGIAPSSPHPEMTSLPVAPSSAASHATETFLPHVTSYGNAPSSPLPDMTSLPVESASPAPVATETYLQEVTSNGIAPSFPLPDMTSLPVEAVSPGLLSSSVEPGYPELNIATGLWDFTSSPISSLESWTGVEVYSNDQSHYMGIVSTNYNGLYTASEFYKTPDPTNSILMTAVLSSSPVDSLGPANSSAVHINTTSDVSQITTALHTYHPLEMEQSTRSQTMNPRDSSCRCQRVSKSNVSFSNHNTSLLVSQTARQRNRKQSAPDNRLSAIAIGSSAVFLLVGFVLIIVCSDIVSLLSSRYERRQNILSQALSKTTRNTTAADGNHSAYSTEGTLKGRVSLP